MRILLDQDEVLAKWVDRIVEWYNEDRGTFYTAEDIKGYTVEEYLPYSKDFIRSCCRYPELYRDLEPVDGAIEGVKELQALGHDVLIVSAVPKCAGFAYHGKLEWLRRNMPFFDLRNFIAAHRKDLVRGDVLLDDRPENLRAFKEMGCSVVFDRPWNRGMEDHYKRVRSWAEFIDWVKETTK